MKEIEKKKDGGKQRALTTSHHGVHVSQMNCYRDLYPCIDNKIIHGLGICKSLYQYYRTDSYQSIFRKTISAIYLSCFDVAPPALSPH